MHLHKQPAGSSAWSRVFVISTVPFSQKNCLLEEIQLLDEIEDMPNFYNKVDLNILTSSHGEAFPNVLAESMSCETPCLSTDIGDAKKRSLEISNYLENLNNAYFAGFKYIDDAVLVNGTLHPIVLMDWVDGQTLKEYINSNITNTSKINAYAFSGELFLAVLKINGSIPNLKAVEKRVINRANL